MSSPFSENLHWLMMGNPFSMAIISTGTSLLTPLTERTIQVTIGKNVPAAAPPIVEEAAVVVSPALWEISGLNYYCVRGAGLSGATAIMMAAIGSRYINLKENQRDSSQAAFDVAIRAHFINTILLMLVPLVKRPSLTGSLVFGGSLLFSGGLYCRAITGKTYLDGLVILGGGLLAFAWLTIIF